MLSQWRALGVNPEVVFFGIEPKDMAGWGMDLSDCIREKIPRIIALVVDELKKDGIRVTETMTS